MIKDLITNSTFWEAFSAIGTLLAVVVSLYLARPKKKISLLCDINTTTIKYKGPKNGDKKIVVTIKNIGDVPVVIMEAGFEIDKREIDTSIDKYKKSIDFPLKIKSGEIEFIEYYISRFNDDYDQFVKKLDNNKFTLRDSSGNSYLII